MVIDETRVCPTCLGNLLYVKACPCETRSSSATIIGSLASDIYRCPEHGLWRFSMSGAVSPYIDRVKSKV
jgi:hypothetical protein